MAKVFLCGNVYTMVSDVSVEDLKDAMKYAPEALQILDEKGEEVEFAINFGSSGSIGKYGVCFDAETNDGTGKACITQPLPAGCKNAVDYIVDKVGPIRSKIAQIEAGLPAALEAVKADRAATREEIEVLA